MYLRNQSITTKYYQIVQVWKNFNKDLPNCTSLKALQQRFTQLYKSETTSTKYYKIVQVWKHFNKDLPNCTSLKALQQSFTQLCKSESTSTKICLIVQVWKHVNKDLPNCTSQKPNESLVADIPEKKLVKFIHTYHPVWWRIKIWKILHMQNLI
jgi:hypothetical protein